MQNQLCLFGEIENAEMILNDAGKMVPHLELGIKGKKGEIKFNYNTVSDI